MLARDWVAARGGEAIAFIVDHGLRADSAAEAAMTANRLATLGLPARILRLSGLGSRPGLSERARKARYAALEAACHAAGLIDLLLGHHAADQAETLIMRRLRGSGPDGLAGMAPLTETAGLRLWRPLLGFAPGRLRATLRVAGLSWAEDPTNRDLRYTRARIRALRADAEGQGPATQALVEAASLYGRRRTDREAEVAAWLARHVVIRPEGFALLPDDEAWPPEALRRLIRMIAGQAHLPDAETVAPLATNPASVIGAGVSLHGTLLRPAGRLGPGFLLCREAAACAPPVPALAATAWDGRFRRPAGTADLPGQWIGALGPPPSALRARSVLPARVLATLPAFRAADGRLLAVPALDWPEPALPQHRLIFGPTRPATIGFAASGMTAASFRHEGRDVLGEKTSYL
ncbi:tRNA(Ile)-lysidine synthase [Acidisoma sp. 7E03]